MCKGLEEASNGEYQGLEFYQQHGQKPKSLSVLQTLLNGVGLQKVSWPSKPQYMVPVNSWSGREISPSHKAEKHSRPELWR